jgi:putative peptidoglycan lipid II flippase
MMIATMVSRLLGFVRIAVIGAVFGTTGQADVLNAVFTIPNNLRKLMAEGALSSAFIPALSHSLVKDETGMRSRTIVRNILTFQFVVLFPFCLISIVFADPLIRFVLVDFSDSGLTALAVDLFRWFISYLLLISISAVIMGTLNSHNHFFVPAITPILFSVAVITSILLLHGRLGIFSMAVGVIAGGLLQIIFQAPLFRRLGYDFRPDFRFKNDDFRKIMRNWLPVVATASIFTINQQVAVRFATGLETGSSSALNYALVFFQLPFGIFSASVTTVLFPRMSRQASLDDSIGLKESIQHGLRFLLVFLVPSTVFLTVIGKEIIAVAMFRGEFAMEDVLLTSQILTAYSFGLFGVGAFNFLQRFFYSSSNYRIPFVLSLLVAAVDIGLSLWLKETRLRVAGLAWANTIAFSLGTVIMLVIIRQKLEGIHGRSILLTLMKVLIASVPVAAALTLFKLVTSGVWEEGSTLVAFVILLAGGLLGIGIYFLLYILLKVEIAVQLIRKKLKT